MDFLDPFSFDRMGGSTFVPPGVDSGIYVLDNKKALRSSSAADVSDLLHYGDCTEFMYKDTHPRNTSGGQSYPVMGAGRASYMPAPNLPRISTMYNPAELPSQGYPPAERCPSDEYTLSNSRYIFPEKGTTMEKKENFSMRPYTLEQTSCPVNYGSKQDQIDYIRGTNPNITAPGYRWQTTSRDGMNAILDVAADNRPPHYSTNAGNEYSHLYLDPRTLGEPMYKDTGVVIPQVDNFNPRKEKITGLRTAVDSSDDSETKAAASGKKSPYFLTLNLDLRVIFIILLVVIAIAFWSAHNSIKNIAQNIKVRPVPS